MSALQYIILKYTDKIWEDISITVHEFFNKCNYRIILSVTLLTNKSLSIYTLTKIRRQGNPNRARKPCGNSLTFPERFSASESVLENNFLCFLSIGNLSFFENTFLTFLKVFSKTLILLSKTWLALSEILKVF